MCSRSPSGIVSIRSGERGRHSPEGRRAAGFALWPGQGFNLRPQAVVEAAAGVHVYRG